MSEPSGNFCAKPDWQREPLSDFAKFAFDLTAGHVRMLQAGSEMEAERFYRAILALDVAYRKAALDPETKLPSYLTAALYNLVAMLPQTSAAPQMPAMATSGASSPSGVATSADAAQDAINRYAEAGIRRDQRERLEGRPEHDQDVCGRPLKAGS